MPDIKMFINIFSYTAFCLILVTAVTIEVAFINIPFLIICSILLFSLKPSLASALIIFVSAFLLDSLKLFPLGSTSIFIFIVLCGIEIYEQKFEIRNFQFILAVTLFAVIIYSLLFHYGVAYAIYAIGILCVITIYLIKQYIFRKEEKYSL